ncbi:MAG: MFS transporter, partial [Anaerolineae bacterium]|nr:MFS transporter [Anaerolineae bacterium]
MINHFKKIYYEFPRLFWIIVGARFIDALGGTILFPFFALYITQKFGVGMSEAGILLGMSSFFGLFGSMAGGALADKFGRRRLIVFGLVLSALSSLLFGLADRINVLYPLVIIVGLLSSLAHPAHEAMLADILPEKKRQEGFGILRVVFNYAWIFGTALGGFIATRSFFALFVTDSILSCIVAVLIYRLLPETKPTSRAETQEEASFLQTVIGYRIVLRDLVYVGYILACILALIVYQQQYSTLSVYMRDVHNIDSKGYGLILSITGLEVVLFQFWISRKMRHYAPFLIMMMGTIFFAIGVFMYGVVSNFTMFMIAAIVVCIGEMLFFPTSQALVASFAPEDMRGRYMAVLGLTWSIPATIGPGAAGYILDNTNPSSLWYIGGFIC